VSLYQLDKAIKLLTHNLDPVPFQRFVVDPAAYADGFELSEAERKALMEKDIGALYALGAQPFILQALGFRLGGETDFMAYFKKYVAIVAPHGHPNYET
jgi:hypothetical protein